MADDKNKDKDLVNFDEIEYFDAEDVPEEAEPDASLSTSKYSKNKQQRKPDENKTSKPAEEVYQPKEETVDTGKIVELFPADFDTEDMADSQEDSETEENGPEEPADEEESEEIQEENEDESFEEYEDDDDWDDDDGNEKTVSVKVLVYVLICIAAAAVVFVAVMTAGGPIERMRQGISSGIQNMASKGSDSSIPTPEPTYRPIGRQMKILPFEEASGSKYGMYKSGMAVAKANKLFYIDTSGKIQWELDTPVVDPILCTAKDYVLIAEKGGNKFCLYLQNKLVYLKESENKILSANLSYNGDVVLVTDKSYYKGAVEVYNRDGEKIFAWNSGSGSVMAADISPKTRRVAVAVMNTDEAVKSTVMMFDVNKTESYAQEEFDNCAVFSLQFIDERLNVLGDNRVLCMNSSGRVLWKAEYGEGEFSNTAVDDKGNRAVFLDKENKPQFSYYTASGKETYVFNPDKLADYVDIYGNNLIYNSGRDILMYDLKSGDIHSYTATMDVYGLYMLDDKTCILVYNNSIEFIEL